MAGIKGLGKGDRQNAEARAKQAIDPEAQEDAAEDFIGGSAKRVKSSGRNERPRVYERCMFSLTKAVSEDIDHISYMPRDFRVNRSDVVNAAIDFLKSHPAEEVIKQLMKVK